MWCCDLICTHEEVLGFCERMIEEVTIVGWLAVALQAVGRHHPSFLQTERRIRGLAASGALSVRAWHPSSLVPRSRPGGSPGVVFPRSFAAPIPATAAGTFCTVRADGPAVWPDPAGQLCRYISSANARAVVETERPTDLYGWRQHPGRGAFSGYCWRPGGRPCRWGYRVGGERTGSSQSGRRWYQTQRVAARLAASSVKRTPRPHHHHHHHRRLLRASFDFCTGVYNTKQSVSLVQ